MKGLTKIAAFFTAIALAVTSLSLIETSGTAVYAALASEGYFYKQLDTELSRAFYNAMEQMLEKGVFKTGKDDFDLVENDLLTSEKAEEYGVTEMLSQYGAARDAFCADHADIFYVDFSYLTLRVTTDSNGDYHVYLGAGRSDNYYTEGFTDEAQVNSAIAEYETKLNEIVSGAKAVSVEEGDNKDAEMVKYVHDYIIDHTSYRLEDVCKPENIGFIRTPYGSIVKGEAVCEGYSRALKAVLDRLDIPCVLVYGVYMHNPDAPELHMWCEVEIDGVWYAVDATMDDPRGSSKKQGIDGWENQDYLLVGKSCMDRRHYSSGIMSPAEYEFTYPRISDDGYNVEVVGSYGALTVKYKDDGELEGDRAGVFYVSYNGMGYSEAAKQGKYIIAKMSQYYERTDEWEIGDWGYIPQEIYPAFEDYGTETRIPVPHVQYVEFAVTDVPPKEDPTDPDYSFTGDITAFSAYSGVLYNPSGTYVKPPCIKSVSPSLSCMIEVEKTHHVVVVYDDKLELAEGYTQPGVAMSAKNALQYSAPCSAERFAKVENVKWDGISTVEFDFTPSRMWLDDSVFYTFNITGLVGIRSGKVPNPISYATRFSMCSCAYRSQGYYWSLFGKPTLMDGFDQDMSDWTTADGTVGIDQKLASRMVLVASETIEGQNDDMLAEIKNETGEKILASHTYNINLTVCKAQVVSTGQSVRVHLGFPEGYGPNDAGVTFKAYHFIMNDQGEIKEVEEIPCIITQYGLVILCKSFSPYAIVAVPADENADTAKSVILSPVENGTVEGAEGIFTLEKGETKTVKVTAKEGYVIESITAAGKAIDITDNQSMDVTVSYSDISGSSGIIDVKLVAEAVYELDEERGETAVVAVPEELEGSDNGDTDTDTDTQPDDEQDDEQNKDQQGSQGGNNNNGTVTPSFTASDDPADEPEETTAETEDTTTEPEPEETTEAADPEPESTTEEAVTEPEITIEATAPEPESTTEAAAPEPEITTEAAVSEPENIAGAGSENSSASGEAGSENGSAEGQDSDGNPYTGSSLRLIPIAVLLAAEVSIIIAAKKKQS